MLSAAYFKEELDRRKHDCTAWHASKNMLWESLDFHIYPCNAEMTSGINNNFGIYRNLTVNCVYISKQVIKRKRKLIAIEDNSFTVLYLRSIKDKWSKRKLLSSDITNQQYLINTY